MPKTTERWRYAILKFVVTKTYNRIHVVMWPLASPFLLVTLAVGAVLSLTPYGYHSNFGYLSGEKPFLTLRNMPVQMCILECQLRNACMAVNYWRQRRDCEMLLTDEGPLFHQNASKHVSLFIKKSEVQPLSIIDMVTCSKCNNSMVCNVSAQSCQIKECRRLHIDNGVVLGNMLSVGSRVRIACDAKFNMTPPEPLSVCMSDGTWSNVPTCIQVACPANWYQIGKSCYLYPNDVSTAMDVFSAQDYCHTRSGYLLQLETEEEANAVENYLFTNYGNITVWLGITDEGTEGTWRWMETNEVATYLDWFSGQPAGGSAYNYARLRQDWTWADRPWNNAFQPVCEKSLVSPST